MQNGYTCTCTVSCLSDKHHISTKIQNVKYITYIKCLNTVYITIQYLLSYDYIVAMTLQPYIQYIITQAIEYALIHFLRIIQCSYILQVQHINNYCIGTNAIIVMSLLSDEGLHCSTSSFTPMDHILGLETQA